MKLSESDLQQLYQSMTARHATPSGECLSEDVLIQLASNVLTKEQRGDAVAHIAKCSDCAREYRIARSLRPMGTAPAPRWMGIAAAAAIAITLSGLIWFVAAWRHGEQTIVQLRQELEAARQRPVKVATVEAPRPQLGVPIIDLDGDLTRGASPPAPSVIVPPTSDVFALILHLRPGTGKTLDLELANHDGSVLWRDHLESDPQSGSVTIALNRKSLPAGAYTIGVLSAGKRTTYRFQVEYR
jgi:hypothetical protein